jgi:hypothetical protein
MHLIGCEFDLTIELNPVQIFALKRDEILYQEQELNIEHTGCDLLIHFANQAFLKGLADFDPAPREGHVFLPRAEISLDQNALPRAIKDDGSPAWPVLPALKDLAKKRAIVSQRLTFLPRSGTAVMSLGRRPRLYPHLAIGAKCTAGLVAAAPV